MARVLSTTSGMPGAVRDRGDGGDVEDLVHRVGDRLGEERPRGRAHQRAPGAGVAGVGDEVDLDAEPREVLAGTARASPRRGPGGETWSPAPQQPEQRDGHRRLAGADHDRRRSRPPARPGAARGRPSSGWRGGCRRSRRPHRRSGRGPASKSSKTEAGRHVDRGRPGRRAAGVGRANRRGPAGWRSRAGTGRATSRGPSGGAGGRRSGGQARQVIPALRSRSTTRRRVSGFHGIVRRTVGFLPIGPGGSTCPGGRLLRRRRARSLSRSGWLVQ